LKRSTIQDVALAAGVGAGTVSRVLNNDPHVSEATRQRVQTAIEQSQYRPSHAARHLRTQKSDTIGFVTDYVATTPFAGAMIKGAQDAAWAAGKLLLIFNTGVSSEMQEAALQHMRDRDVDGIVYAAMWHREVVISPIARQVPLVLLDCFSRDGAFASVVPDEFQGGYDATKVLIDRGHRRIGFINIDLSVSEPAPVGRLAGYKAALADANIDFELALVVSGNARADDGYRRTRDLMALPVPPSAIFCGNDRMAMGCYEALRDLERRVPHDVAVIGFDNQSIIAKYLRPALSTMALPHYEMGRWAVEHLLGTGATPGGAPPQHKIACPYVERESV